MDEFNQKIVSLKNLSDGQCLILRGPGEFKIGLTSEDKLTSALITNSTDIKVTDDNEIIMSLVNLTVWNNSGATVSPGNKDLPCRLNEETVTSEVNLLPGSVIEVGDKQLQFCDDSTPARPRRCLPPTPGVPIMPQPPPKPERRGSATSNIGEGLTGMSGPSISRTRPLSLRKPPPLPSDWAVIELPSTDAELLKCTRKPEQLASLAASYVTKHIHLHTDARINSELTDQIFSAMLEVAHHQRSILQRFLTDLIEEQANESASDDQPPEPSHGSVMLLLREILRQFLDPQSLVLVSLVMLRALSHISGASQLLVECELTTAILGTMAAMRSAATIQEYCLDILAKIALYQPCPAQKPPLRESATDLICLALISHPKSVTIAQSACRAVANLSTTLYTAVSNTLDTSSSSSPELQNFVFSLLGVLDYLLTKCLPVVQSVLSSHGSDLTVHTECRRFLFIYSKQEQLRQRKDQWLSSTPMEVSAPPLTERSAPPLPSRTPFEPMPQAPDDENRLDSPPPGIMKRSRSYENLRRPEREVTFDHGELESTSSTSSSERGQESDDEENPVEIISQKKISVSQPMETSPDSTTFKRTVTISHHDHDPAYSEVVIGRRPAVEGQDSPLSQPTEYENWDLLRGVLRKKSGLKEHQYLAADITFMIRLAKTQVVALVCALAVDGNVREALNLVDQPIQKVVFTKDVPPGVRDFVQRQYSTTDTLMDVDPGLMVSIIDAVRYRSLSFEMAQKCVLGVLRALDDQQQGPVVAVTVEFLAATITNKPLAMAMTEARFVAEVCHELQRAQQVSKNSSALRSLLDEIKLCAGCNPQ